MWSRKLELLTALSHELREYFKRQELHSEGFVVVVHERPRQQTIGILYFVLQVRRGIRHAAGEITKDYWQTVIAFCHGQEIVLRWIICTTTSMVCVINTCLSEALFCVVARTDGVQCCLRMRAALV